MKRRLFALLAAAAVSLSAGAAAGVAGGDVTLTPVTRLPFPERGYVVDLPENVDVSGARLRVTENGRSVRDVKVTPLATSGLRSGVVLALDASESMTGAAFESAIAAARDFVARRRSGEQIGLVAFNGAVRVLRAPTESRAEVRAALRSPPPLAYGTRIYDALDASIGLLHRARLSPGSVVVLSDGSDTGSEKQLDAVLASARRRHVRIFTVGLRSGAFNADTLRTIADRTGGSYAEATTSAELASIYAALRQRFAREYVVEYRSDARPRSHVDVRLTVAGVGTVSAEYVAPTPARVAPYHRSLAARFLLSPASIFALALVGAAVAAWAVLKIARRRDTMVVERIEEFSGPSPAVHRGQDADAPPRLGRARYTHGWWARLERDLEIARIKTSPRVIVGATLAATLTLFVLIAAVAPLVAVLALMTPLLARALVRRRLNGVRNQFADQLPTSLQVLASALRAGHSFSGALGVVVENAHEPAQSELRRVHRDEQLGVPPEVAIRRAAERMANRDLEQVALLAELQRTSGGNTAEVLDTVVSTIRERGELRRLMRTLTAQGRWGRWILTALPVNLAAFLWVFNPEIMAVLFESTGGQISLVIAALMVGAGSALIQRIVEIDV